MLKIDLKIEYRLKSNPFKNNIYFLRLDPFTGNDLEWKDGIYVEDTIIFKNLKFIVVISTLMKNVDDMDIRHAITTSIGKLL